MLRNYLTVAWRNVRKHRFYAALNIVGLALGVTCCLLIAAYVRDELSYDRFNAHADRIFRLHTAIKFGGTEGNYAVSAAPLAATLRRDYPQVQTTVRFRQQGSFLVRKGSQNLKETRVVYADSSLFDVFTLPLLHGDPRTALVTPTAVVITETIARKYFSKTNAVGQTLRFGDDRSYQVTGVMADLPTNAHFHFDFFLAMSGWDESRDDSFLNNNFVTYVRLRPGADPAQLTAQFDGLLRKYVAPQVLAAVNVTWDNFHRSGSYYRLGMMPLTDIHLHSDMVGELEPNGNVQYVYIFSGIAVFILLIACVNFMNLATARSAGRAKEVGVRKVLGSSRSALVGQFLTESVLLSGLAFALAGVLAQGLLPLFNNLANKQLQLGLLSTPWLLPVLVVGAVVVGLLAGSYPAWFLSAFRPVRVLKGRQSGGAAHGGLRSALVVFQFATSVVLIVGTVVIYRQLSYIQHKKLGFDKEQTLVISDPWALGGQQAAFKNEVLRRADVVSGSVSGYLPIPSDRNSMSFFPEGQIQTTNALNMQFWMVDADYLPTMGIELARGRNFSRQFLTDSSAVLINEAAARLLSYADPVGREIRTFSGSPTDPSQMRTFRIVGVVRDFHYESLRQNIGALCMRMGRGEGAISFRLRTTDVAATVAGVEKLWNKMAPGQPFTHSFLDAGFDAIYRTERRVGQLALVFAALAILIACLGLFGLAAYTAEQRTKEIGIRKVLGATTGNIVAMLSGDFMKLVLLACALSFPLAWWAMRRWLQDFAYRIEIGWWVFAAAGGGALLIALLTVSYQAIRAALANPVKSLRTE